MSVTKFKTTKYTYRDEALITPVVCERETPSSVFINDPCFKTTRREAKVSEYVQYHDTWEQAQAFLIARSEKKVTSAERALAEARKVLEQALALPEGQP